MRRTLVLTVAAAALAAGPLSPPAAAAPARSAWRWPLPSPVAITRAFEPPAGPYAAGHRGVDLAAPAGAVVRAAGAGTVVLAGLVAGVPVVVVAHGSNRTSDELMTTYEPAVASVGVGAQVEAGRPIGTVGSWPGHCDDGDGCLHWGLRRGETYLDPMTLFDGPVRLLPTTASPTISPTSTAPPSTDAIAPSITVSPSVLRTARALVAVTRLHPGRAGPRGSPP